MTMFRSKSAVARLYATAREDYWIHPIHFLRGAVVAGIGANFGMLGSTLVIQLASVPLFLSTVGTHTYGEWLVVSALPSYLSLSDFGFAGAAATMATQELGRGRADKARNILASAWALVTVLMFIGMAGLLLLGLILFRSGAFPVVESSVYPVFMLLLVWVGLWMQLGYAEAALRASGYYPRGMAYLSTLRLIEFIAQAAALLAFRSLTTGALALVAVRLVGTVWIHLVTRKLLPWFRISPRFASGTSIRELIGPSLTYAGFPFGQAIQYQGIVLLVGAVLNPISVVTLATVRTMTNTLAQLTLTPLGGALPEITRSLSFGDLDRAWRIHKKVGVIVAVLTSVAAVVLILEGGSIVRLWTHGHVRASSFFVVLMVVTTIADIPWQISVNTLRAMNRHQLTGIGYLLGCLLSVALAGLLLKDLGLPAVPIGLFLLDVVVVPLSWQQLRRSRRLYECRVYPEIEARCSPLPGSA